MLTLFTVEALNQHVNTYDPAAPSAPYGWASLMSFGGMTTYYSPLRFSDQCSRGEIVVGRDAVPPPQPLNLPGDSVFHRCGYFIGFGGRNVSPSQQYQLVFTLRGAGGTPTAQFFIGNVLVDSEPLSYNPFEFEQHSLLVDVPGDGVGMSLWIRLASDDRNSAMAFQSMACLVI